jgi:septum formation protein
MPSAPRRVHRLAEHLGLTDHDRIVRMSTTISNPDDHLASPRPLLLASASPRRRELLAALGRSYQSSTADIDESALPGEEPAAFVLRMAESKARAVADRLHAKEESGGKDGRGSIQALPLVIGSDTIVVHGGRILGKPASRQEAKAVLRELRNQRHLVHTGVAVVDPVSGKVRRDLGTTGVWMRNYHDEEIETYVASGDPMDKAGAYAIQHPGFRPVARLEGSEANVIGLPLALLATLLGRFDREA